jgi:serine/threonine-protein kinase
MALPGDTPAPGSRIGPYELRRRAGQGSTGEVFEAHAASTGQRVAVKLLYPVPDPPSLEPALAAHLALQRLQHEHIVTHLDAGWHRERAWVATAWAPGCDLTRYTRLAWLLPPEKVLSVGRQIAAALDCAHRAGVTHRDLKPANVRLHLPSGRLWLTDFGLATGLEPGVSLTGVLKGTPRYMAPEQLLGDPASARSDLYALGVVLYELLTGRCPHEAPTLRELLTQVVDGRHTPVAALAPEAPPALQALVDQLLARDPSWRPTTAHEVLARLDAASAAPTSTTPTPSNGAP